MTKLALAIFVLMTPGCGRNNNANDTAESNDDLTNVFGNLNNEVIEEMRSLEQPEQIEHDSVLPSPVPSSVSYPPPLQMKSYDQFRDLLSNESNFIFDQKILFQDPYSEGYVDQETLDRLSLIAKELASVLAVARAELKETFSGWEPAIEGVLRSPEILLDDEDPMKWAIIGEIEGSPVSWSAHFDGVEFIDISAGG